MRIGATASAGATLLLLGLGAWAALGWPLHPDVAFYTTAARELAGGAVLYRDVGDVNPPGIYWLHLALAALADRSGRADQTVLVLAYVLLAGAALLWSQRLLARLPPGAGRGGALLLPPLLAAALTFAALGVFGEREHWALPLLLPHLAAGALLAAGSPPPRRQALLAGALAGLACLLKPPYLLLALLLPELWLAWRLRRPALLRRPAILAAAAAFLLVGGLQLLLHPEFLRRVVPEALLYYAALGRPLADLLTPRGVWLPLALLLWALALVRSRPAAGPFLWAATGAALAYLLQAKGFAYQWLPVLVLALAGSLLLLADGGWRRPLRLPLLLLALWIGYLGWQQVGAGGRAWPDARALAAALAPGERVLALNPEIYPLFPAVTLAGARWVSPESHLWQLDGLYRLAPAGAEPAGFRPPERQPPAEAEQRRRLVEHFLAVRPDVVAVYLGDGTPTIGGSPFRYLDYLLADADFALAWQGYRPAARIGDYALYRPAP